MLDNKAITFIQKFKRQGKTAAWIQGRLFELGFKSERTGGPLGVQTINRYMEPIKRGGLKVASTKAGTKKKTLAKRKPAAITKKKSIARGPRKVATAKGKKRSTKAT